MIRLKSNLFSYLFKKKLYAQSTYTEKQGFSIVEILVALGLVALIGAAIASVVTSASKQQKGIQAKDQQREVTSEIRTLLGDRTACLNTFGGNDPDAAGTPKGFTVTTIKDGTASPGVTKYAVNTNDKTGLLTFKEFRVTNWNPDAIVTQGTADFLVKLSKVDATSGTSTSLLPDVITLRVRRDATTKKITDCFSVGKQSDGVWQITPSNSNNIMYKAGNVGIGTDVPASSLDIRTDLPTAPAVFKALNVTRDFNGNAIANSAAAYIGGFDAGYPNIGLYIDQKDGSNFSDNASYILNAVGGTAGTSQFVVTGAGNVGIGTANPNSALDVIGVVSTTWGTAFNTSFVGGAWKQTSDGYAGLLQFDPTAGKFYFWNSLASAVAGSANPLPTQSMTIDKSGNVGIGTTNPDFNLTVGNGARINGLILGASSSGVALAYPYESIGVQPGMNLRLQSPDAILFHTAMTSSEPSNSSKARMIIDILGNVGIGTTAPATILHVGSPGSGATVVTVGNDSTGGAAQSVIELVSSNGLSRRLDDPNTKGWQISAVGNTYASASLKNDFRLAFWDGATMASGLFRTDFLIDSTTGKVGIGTMTPLSTLHVGGGLRAAKGDAITFDSSNVGYAFEADGDTGMFAINGNAFSGSDLIFKTDSGERIRIQSGTGNVGIATTNPGYKLDVQGGDINASGSVRASGVALTSDIRFKKDIQTLDLSLEKILSIRGVEYNWRTSEFPDRLFNDRHQIGVIAQEVEKVFPEVVDTGTDGFKSVNYPALIAPLIEAVKKLYNRITGVEAHQTTQDRRIAAVVADKAAVDAKVQQLQAENVAIKTQAAQAQADNAAKTKEITALKHQAKALKNYLCAKDPGAAICK